MIDHGVSMSLTMMEGMHLAQLVADFRDLLIEPDDGEDLGLARLMPDPYPDDADASREFADAVRDDLNDRRVHDSLIVSAALGQFDLEAEVTQIEALTEHTVAIPAAAIDAWMRTLNALRLVIASRLNIETEDDRDVEDPRFGIYDWLGYRLELLIQSADELL